MASLLQPNLRRIRRIAPLQAGKMLAVLYGCMGLLFLPLLLLMSLSMAQLPPAQRGPFALVGAGFIVLAPVFYAAMGFVTGLIGSILYNVTARWLGGLEVEVD